MASWGANQGDFDDGDWEESGVTAPLRKRGMQSRARELPLPLGLQIFSVHPIYGCEALLMNGISVEGHCESFSLLC
jgi:hypothetical protein